MSDFNFDELLQQVGAPQPRGRLPMDLARLIRHAWWANPASAAQHIEVNARHLMHLNPEGKPEHPQLHGCWVSHWRPVGVDIDLWPPTPPPDNTEEYKRRLQEGKAPYAPWLHTWAVGKSETFPAYLARAVPIVYLASRFFWTAKRPDGGTVMGTYTKVASQGKPSSKLEIIGWPYFMTSDGDMVPARDTLVMLSVSGVGASFARRALAEALQWARQQSPTAAVPFYIGSWRPGEHGHRTRVVGKTKQARITEIVWGPCDAPPLPDGLNEKRLEFMKQIANAKWAQVEDVNAPQEREQEVEPDETLLDEVLDDLPGPDEVLPY